MEILSSPAMIAALALVLVVQALSLLMLVINVQLYRTQFRKYREFLESLGEETAWGMSGRLLIPLYLLLTIGATAVMLFLFIVQPHLL